MQKYKIWFIFLCLINFYLLFGNDIFLVKVFFYENVINIIVYDEKGIVYVFFDFGVYVLDINNGDLVFYDFLYNDVIYYVDCFIYLIQIFDDFV